MQLHNMEAKKLVDETGFLIVETRAFGALDWQHLVFVANMDSGRSGMSGFACTPGGKPRPATPDDMEVLNRISTLRNMMTRESGRSWSMCQLAKALKPPACL